PPPAPPRVPEPAQSASAPARAPGGAVERPPGDGLPGPVKLAPAAPAAIPPQAAQGSTGLRQAPEEAPSPKTPATSQATVAGSPPPPLPFVRKDPVAEPGTGATSAAPPPPASPPPTDAARGSAQPATGETLPRLSLDVLVYSDVPAERLVFINGRKYVEGQAMASDSIVEQITPDGAILRYQGKQLLLRPKLNPYSRSGSP